MGPGVFFAGAAAHDSYLLRVEGATALEDISGKKKKLEGGTLELKKPLPKLSVQIADRLHNVGPIHDCILNFDGKGTRILTVASGHGKLGYITAFYVFRFFIP